MGIRVCTYNMGTNISDYIMLCQFLDPKFDIPKDHEKAFEEQYAQAQEKVATELQNLADVYLLQEVDEERRPLLVKLKEKNFQIFRHVAKPPHEKSCDCAIALSPDFHEAQNHSRTLDVQGLSYDVAVVTAIHKPTDKKITFASAHAPGCDLDGTVDKLDAATGDGYCLKIAAYLDEIGASTLQILGSDMNANPEKWISRFSPFLDKKYEVCRTGAPTNLKPGSKVYRERELDFIFVKFPPMSIKEKLFSFGSEKKIQLLSQPLRWRIDLNASDHLPVVAKILLN